jgi:hypothetical protein
VLTITPETLENLRQIIRLARLGEPEEVARIISFEAFFTSTAFSMLPCTKINGLRVGDGKVGPMFRRLVDAWSEEVGVDIIVQTKAFAAEADAALSSGTSTYWFGERENR